MNGIDAAIEYDIDKVSPRPWVTDDSNVEMIAILKDGIYHYIGACGADTTNYVDTMSQDESESNAAHIVHCVNTHATLVSEIKQLNDTISTQKAYQEKFATTAKNSWEVKEAEVNRLVSLIGRLAGALDETNTSMLFMRGEYAQKYGTYVPFDERLKQNRALIAEAKAVGI